MTSPHIIWIAAHLMLATMLLINKKKISKSFYTILIILLLVSFFMKGFTYDLVIYMDYFSNPSGRSDFDWLFGTISKFFYILGFGSFGIYIAFLLLSVIFTNNICRNVLQVGRGISTIYPVTASALLSIFFLLGSQNVLRQFLAVIFVTTSYFLFLKNKKLQSSFYLFISPFIHSGVLVFAFILFLSLILGRLRVGWSAVIASFSGFIFIVLLKFMLPESDYLKSEFSWGDERTSPIIKLLFFTVIILSTDFLFRGRSSRQEPLLREAFRARWVILAFSAPVAIVGLNDLFSRIFYPAFIFEVIMISKVLISGGRFRERLAVVIMLVGYSVAPNVSNIYNQNIIG